MTDPVAEAAAKIAADAAPSSTEPSLLEKAMDTIHDLEAKVEHLIHPETSINAVSELIGEHDDSDVLHGPDVGNVAGAAVAGAPEAGAAPAGGGELPNVAGATASQTDPLAPSGTDTTSTLTSQGSGSNTPDTLTSQASSTEPAGSIEVPNAVLAAVEQLGSQTSAAPVSTPAGIPGIVVSSVAEPVKLVSAAESAIRVGIANIKHHLSIRGFEQSAVADIHAELEAIEKWL